jgi:hypothetical protein
MPNGLPPEVAEAADAVSEEYGADVYLYSGEIDDDGLGQLVTALSRHKTKDKAILLLTTNGGSANVAYQIARIFQKMYDEFIVCPPSYCKSAGTLVVLGAHRLLVDMVTDLGPLDVQLFKQNEIGARKSGLLAKSSFEALGEAAFSLYERLMLGITMGSGGLVTFKMASELSATIASNLLAPIYGQMNPDVVGSEHRDLNVAMQYGLRLIRHSDNATFLTVNRLIEDYPSHDFIIDDDEIRDLFKNVDIPSENLYSVIALVGELAYDEASSTVVLGLTRPNKQKDQTDEHGRQVDEQEVPAGAPGGGDAVDADRSGDRRGDPQPPKPDDDEWPTPDSGPGTAGPAANSDEPTEKGDPRLRAAGGEK